MTAPAKTRKRVRYHHGNLPTALVEAASKLIEEKGREGVTLRAVAQQVGVTHAAPYRHFRNKAALLTAVALAGFTQLADAMAVARRGQDSATAGLKAAGLAYLRFATEQAGRFRLMFDQPPQRTDGRAEEQAAGHVWAEIERAVAAFSADASPRSSADRAHLPLLLWSQWHGLATLAASHRHAIAGELAEHLIEATQRLMRMGRTGSADTTVPAPAITIIPAHRE